MGWDVLSLRVRLKGGRQNAPKGCNAPQGAILKQETGWSEAPREFEGAIRGKNAWPSSDFRFQMECQPDADMVRVGPFDPVSAMRWQPETITNGHRNQIVLAFKTQLGAALKQ